MKKTGFLLAAFAASLMATSALAQDITVKIGVLNDQSSLYADSGGVGSILATRMAVEDFDAEAKGIKVEIISADHQNKPDVGSNIARQWFDEEGVDIIVDLPASSVALAVSQVAREKNRIALVSSAATSDITGKGCSPNTIHWTYDTYSLAQGTGKAMVQQGGDTWFFLTADYAFGHALERDTAAVVEAAGGKVLGSVKTPFPGTDFSSYLLQAQASGAKVVGLANAGGDTIASIKQAGEFGITDSGQKLAGLLVYVTDVHALGLEAAGGIVLTSPFYWDLNDDTRAWSKRFGERHDGRMPTMLQAGAYSGTLHYLKAVEAAKSTDPQIVLAKMKEMRTSDPLFGEGYIRPEDGRKVHNMYLFEVKTPSEMTGPWDYYKQIAVLPGEETIRPLAESECPLVNG